MQSAQTLLYDRYSILHIERSNSFNQVLFVLDTYQNPPRSCVIKIFQPIAEKVQITEWIDREFPKEANRLKQLSLYNHHLPQIYTYSNHSHSYYIVRELVEGKTLREKVQTTGILSTLEVRKILIQLLSVLDYLHDRGVIHQNIKPKNIILRDDLFPMLINFGSVKQIVATYSFHGDKQIFSSNNIYGYAPSEQALGKSVPATDLYSLGLTAVYLLTAQDPIDLSIDSNSSRFKLPSIIACLDPDLERILDRAINPNLGDRYSSAKEMLEDLSDKSSICDRQKTLKNHSNSIPLIPSFNIKSNSDKNLQDNSNWWKIPIYIISSLYITGAATIVWYDWNLNQNAFVPPLPDPLSFFPLAEPPQEPANTKPSMLNSRGKDLVEIPIFVTGTQKQQLRKVLGEPDLIQKGYWANSNAWIYKQRSNGLIDMGYLFDLDSDKLRQTEMAIASSLDLTTIEEIFDGLLQGNITPVVSQALAKIYQHQIDEYSFKLGNLEGNIQRQQGDRIYLGVWEADFH